MASKVAGSKAKKVAAELIKHWKVLRGDKVYINAGKDKGLTGVVREVKRSENKVVVEGRNLVRRYVRTADGNSTTVSVEKGVHYSNVQLLDPVTNSPVRVGYKFLDDGTKVRFTRGANASGEVIPRPEILKQRRELDRQKPAGESILDTPSNVALKDTRPPTTALPPES
eukprot:jgi/Chlat1/8987/Chrsp94S08283